MFDAVIGYIYNMILK